MFRVRVNIGRKLRDEIGGEREDNGLGKIGVGIVGACSVVQAALAENDLIVLEPASVLKCLLIPSKLMSPRE
jgi:hypothetical protein